MRRVTWIDGCRGTALVLAYLAHLFIAFQLEPGDQLSLLTRLFTRAATPAFLVIFGIMLEMTYLRQARSLVDLAPVRLRLFNRAFDCYVVFAAITLAAVAGEHLSPRQGLSAVFYLGPGRFGIILELYALLLVGIAMALPLVLRWGWIGLLGLSAIGWISRHGLNTLDAPEWYPLQFLVGYGTGFGPSVLPGLVFVAFGILIGQALSQPGQRAPVLIFVTLCGMIVGVGMEQLGLRGFVTALVLDFRWSNHPGYFATGIMTSSLLLSVNWWLHRKSRPISSRLSLESIGRNSLFVYGMGNILMNLVPRLTLPADSRLYWSLAFTIGFGFFYVYRKRILQHLERHAFGLPTAIHGLYEKQRERILLRLLGNAGH